jgi:hypothetical protein
MLVEARAYAETSARGGVPAPASAIEVGAWRLDAGSPTQATPPMIHRNRNQPARAI